MKVVLDIGKKPGSVTIAAEGRTTRIDTFTVVDFKPKEDNPLVGTATLAPRTGKVCRKDILFRDPSEYPTKGSLFTAASAIVTLRELVESDFLQPPNGITKEILLERSTHGVLNETKDVPVACIVDGRQYLSANREKFASSVILDAFKDAQRV
jgi:hypothetical protein